MFKYFHEITCCCGKYKKSKKILPLCHDNEESHVQRHQNKKEKDGAENCPIEFQNLEIHKSFEETYNFEKEAKKLQKSFKKRHETFTTNVESISLNKVQTTSKIEFNFMGKRKMLKGKKTVTLLLLGASQSGKSTFFKQMRIKLRNGYSTDRERLMFRHLILENLLETLESSILRMQKLEIKFDQNDETLKHIEGLLSYAKLFRSGGRNDINSFLPPEVHWIINKLFEDAVFSDVFKSELNKFCDDNSRYFVSNSLRICSEDYIPTRQDIVHSRATTCGIVEETFAFKNSFFTIIDVGGQRSERMKWLPLFEGTDGMIYFVSLVGYNLFLKEDDTANCMIESMNLFNRLVANPFLSNAHLLLFLNKIDLFREKVEISNLTDCFPDYDGPNEYEAAIDFIQSKFNYLFNEALRSRKVNDVQEQEKCKSYESSEWNDLQAIEDDVSTYASGSWRQRTLYVHKTCATDQQQMNFISDVVYDVVLGSSVNCLFY